MLGCAEELTDRGGKVMSLRSHLQAQLVLVLEII